MHSANAKRMRRVVENQLDHSFSIYLSDPLICSSNTELLITAVSKALDSR